MTSRKATQPILARAASRVLSAVIAFLAPGLAPLLAAEPVLKTPPKLIRFCAEQEEKELAGCHLFPCWAADECRLFCRDNCYRPKTLLVWAGQERTFVNGTEDTDLVSDRPDFTEASSCVGLRRLQIEGGYTYIRDNSADVLSSAHSFPETLFRLGMFTEWCELRIAWNYGINLEQGNIVSNIFDGGQDLYLGCKLALTEQDGWKPEMAIIPQMNVPTGSPDVTEGEVEPGFNWLYGWDVTERIAMGASTQVNRTRDDAEVFYAEFAQSWTINYKLAEKLSGYTEWFAFFPAGSATALPEYYFDGGFTYLVHPNLQLDIRAGVGLNDAADDFFGGSGAVVRF
jgi:hypothetical protein